MLLIHETSSVRNCAMQAALDHLDVDLQLEDSGISPHTTMAAIQH